MSATIDITPNASKTIESLRHLTYTNESAVADIIDNSLDAHANNVWVALVESKNQAERGITILDDGTGMDLETLREAVKLGSNTEKSSLDLGRFGMGLVTASISMARRLEVITKLEGGELHKVTLDLDFIADNDSWGATEDSPNLVEKAAFTDIKSGTLVKISKIDRLKWARMSTVEAKFTEEFGQTFRKFLDAGKNIYINRKLIQSIDPLELNNQKTEVMFDEDIDFKGSKISVKFVLTEQVGADTATARGYNIPNQGVYIVRNERQIAKAVSLGIFTKHNDFNRVRIEVSYGQNLDDFFGLNFTKNEVTPDQALSDKLKQELHQFFVLARKRQKAIQAVRNQEKLDHSEAEDVISRKGKLLKTSNVMEKRSSPAKTSKPKPATPAGTKNRENIRKFQSGNRTIIVKFGEVDLGETGDLYQYDFEGTMTVINWNISHPFHREMVAKYSNEKNISLPLDFFLFSLVTAELSVTNDETLHLLEQIKSTLSTNLRVLMK